MMIGFVLTINLLYLCGNRKSRNNLLMTWLYAAEAASTLNRAKPGRIDMLGQARAKAASRAPGGTSDSTYH